MTTNAADSADRDRRQALSVARIVDATLALIDEQGIGAASMRTVAARLGVRAMSLYKHVDSREVLLDAVVERVVNELADDPLVQTAPDDGWRPYLHAMAHGVRRYARAHPHAFPLVATRPPTAPWINPPLRSVRWVEALLASLATEGFTDEQVLFTYRSFNSFLLGYLLLETSAMALRDPKPGDGSFSTGSTDPDSDAADTNDPVPGGLSPTRTPAQREAIDSADTPHELVDPGDDVDPDAFPVVHRLARGLAADLWEQEFKTGLEQMLDRIESFVSSSGRAGDSGG
ncbi:TetR/AcrR family transcriptional regulator [uncultured Jatrophihabitans sp.]|uniref:TetR/AcrR family transcriptional regulator n=1 Tax=uncultured Jatrophihabitans sp. TaxID=1610747 RepID=UPI0035CC78C2